MSTASRQLLRKEERVESILVAAARAFARAGFAATSMEDIAVEAGITKLIVYRHFSGKKELYEAVLGRVSETLGGAFRDATARHLSAVGLRALLRTARVDESAFLLLFRHASREPAFAGYAEEYISWVTATVEAWLRPVVSDPTLLLWSARVTVAVAVDSVTAWLEVGDPGRDEEFLERTWRGLQGLVAAAEGSRAGAEGPRAGGTVR
jgi:AcrR family transcriptional regulator